MLHAQQTRLASMLSLLLACMHFMDTCMQYMAHTKSEYRITDSYAKITILQAICQNRAYSSKCAMHRQSCLAGHPHASTTSFHLLVFI
jgi:hypothetical protein